MGIKYYSDYTLEDLKKERKRHKELNPPPFILDEFTEEVCKKFGGEWDEKWGDNTCTIAEIEGIAFEPSKITIGVRTKEPYTFKHIVYNGNYDLLFNFYSDEEAMREKLGAIKLISLNDKFFSKVRKEKQELKIPYKKEDNVIYIPSEHHVSLKMKLINPESGFYRCSTPNIHGRYTKVDCLEFDMDIYPRKKKKETEE